MIVLAYLLYIGACFYIGWCAGKIGKRINCMIDDKWSTENKRLCLVRKITCIMFSLFGAIGISILLGRVLSAAGFICI